MSPKFPKYRALSPEESAEYVGANAGEDGIDYDDLAALKQAAAETEAGDQGVLLEDYIAAVRARWAADPLPTSPISPTSGTHA